MTTSSDRVEIRPIASEDKDALAQGFERLGEEYRYRRFLSPHDRLTGDELRYFTEVDHHDHEALVAIYPHTGAGIGVARYVRSNDGPSVADLAVAVVNDHQGQGSALGSSMRSPSGHASRAFAVSPRSCSPRTS
jgi:hypothetical protein